MREERKKELATQPIGKLLFRYSTPAIIGMMFNSLYNLVDAIFIGHGAGPMALGGLAISFPIQMVILSVAMAVGIGTASVISRALGANDDALAERVAGNSIALVLVVSGAVTVVGLIFLDPLLRIFGATDAILPFARDYMEIIFLGAAPYALTISTNNLVRAEGSAKTAMVGVIIGTGLNIILDPIFIFGFGMGIRGAAIATVIAVSVAGLFIAWHYATGRGVVDIKPRLIRIDMEVVPEVLKIGSSSMMRMIAASILAIVINNSMAHYGRDIHLAAYGAISRLMMFLFMPMFGLVQGLQPIVGFNYGARQKERIKTAMRLSNLWSSVYCLLVWSIVMLFTTPLLTMFSTDTELVREGVHILHISAILMPFVGFQMVGASMFQAIGKAGPALLLSTARQVLFLIPLILALPLFYGFDGIWYSFPIADCLAVGVTAIWYLREMRLMERLDTVAEETEPTEPVLGDSTL